MNMISNNEPGGNTKFNSLLFLEMCLEVDEGSCRKVDETMMMLGYKSISMVSKYRILSSVALLYVASTFLDDHDETI